MNKGELTKTHMLAEAVQLASIYGLQGLTIGGLAQHIHMSKGGICAHFASKQVLQLAVIEHAAEIFQKAVIEPALVSQPGVERLRQLGEAWLAYLERSVFQGGCFFTNVILEVDDLEDHLVRESARRQYQRFLAFVGSEVNAALRQGQFRASLERDQFVFEFMGILLGALIWRGLDRQRDGLLLARRSLLDSLARAQT